MSLMRSFARFNFTIALAALIFAAAGCASLNEINQPTPQQQAQEIEPMLAAAGFAMLPANTAERQQQIAALPPLKVSYYVGRTGKLHYWMADPDFCKCMYLGSEQAYQRYEQIKLQAKWQEKETETARENLEAAQEEQMDEQMEMFNPYGYGFVGPGFWMY